MHLRTIFLLLTIIATSLTAKNFSYELKVNRRLTDEIIWPVDKDKDNTDELYSCTFYHFAVLDQSGNFITDHYFTKKIESITKRFSICDFNYDGINELFMTLKTDTAMHVFCFDPTTNNVISKIPFVWAAPRKNKDTKWDGGLIALNGIDANDDDRFDVVLKIVTGGDIIQRGIIVYDIETGKELWHYWVGPEVYNVIANDLNNDGKPEIILGTYSPGKGHNVNNTVGRESYIIVLNRNGSLLWQKKVGELFSEALVVVEDCDLDGYKEIITASSNRRAVIDSTEKQEPDKLWILNAVTGEEKKCIPVGQNIWGLICTDINNDKKFEIITGNSDGNIRIFNSRLKQIKNYQNNIGIEVKNVFDMNGDGQKEIITTTENNELVIFNRKLKRIASTELQHTILHKQFSINLQNIWPIKTGKQMKLLIPLPKERQNEFILYELYCIPFLNRRIPVLSVTLGAILLLLLFSIGMIYARYTKTRDIRTVIRGLTHKSGVIEINHEGDIITISQKARDILNIKDKTDAMTKLSEVKGLTPILELAKSMITDLKTQSPQETAVSLTQEQSYLVRCIRVKKGVLITFEDISAVEYMKRVTSWAPVAQKLAHGIKTPLMNIQLSAEQLESACEPVKDKTDKIIDGIKSEAKRLRKLTDNFMRFTQFSQLDLASENINSILNDLCNKYSFSMPQHIKIECNLTQNLPELMLNRKELENALAIIIENAVEAMVNREPGEEKKQDKLSIKTLLSEKSELEKIKKYVIVEISDTGRGIPQKYLSELFKPYFTYGKPEGTGLGLPLAKKIIESHNGKIEISSQENIGTSVSIFLPTQ